MAVKRTIHKRSGAKKSSRKKSSVKKSSKKKSSSKTAKKTAAKPLPKSLFDILCCPVCKSELRYTQGHSGLVCKNCDHTYTITEGVPVLMP